MSGSISFDGAPDDDLEPADMDSPLEQLKASIELKRRAELPLVHLRLTNWDDWLVTYRLPATSAEFTGFQKQVKNSKDAIALQRLMLAKLCVGLQFKGRAMIEDDGSPCTWASVSVRGVLGGTRSVETLTVAYRGALDEGPGDGEIVKHANLLMERAGFGDDIPAWEEEADPTQGR